MRVDKSSCLLFRAFISTVTFLEGSSVVTLPNPVIDCIIVLKICAKITNQLTIDNRQLTIIYTFASIINQLAFDTLYNECQLPIANSQLLCLVY